MEGIIPLVLNEVCTEKQRAYILHYLVDHMSVSEIAVMYGLERSTVSRTINRGLDKLYKYMGYAAPAIYRATMERRPLQRKRRK